MNSKDTAYLESVRKMQFTYRIVLWKNQEYNIKNNTVRIKSGENQ